MATATEAAKKASAPAATRKTRSRKGTAQTPKKRTSNRSAMTDEHKAAIASGREQSRLIGRYLEALDQNKPKRGRKVTKESKERRLAEIEKALPDASALDRVNLIAERERVMEFLAQADGNGDVDIEQLEADFVKHAASYSVRKEIPRSAWRAFGVPPEVLDKAGITRSTV